MNQHEDRARTPFGRRRPAAFQPGSVPEIEAEAQAWQERWDRAWKPSVRTGPNLGWALRTAAAAAFVALLAAQYLSRLGVLVEPSEMRLASGPADPETTGSIGPGRVAAAARATRLDPCALPGASRALR